MTLMAIRPIFGAFVVWTPAAVEIWRRTAQGRKRVLTAREEGYSSDEALLLISHSAPVHLKHGS